MNTPIDLERMVASVLIDTAASREPDGLLRSVLFTTGRMRPRPRWLALIKEPPMRISSRIAVGSPVLRLTYVLILTLILAAVAAGAVAAGASLLPTPAIVVAQDGSGTAKTITEAVAMAQDGDTILVRPGIYPESIAITADITIRGDGDRSAVVLEFAADGPRHEWDFAYGILLDGSGAHVENVTVHGPAEAVRSISTAERP